uniref:Uncharacterized protein n=1 Tax=Solanum tuberosum TaxID=4113 RepID=M1CST2_SOLTU
MKLYCYIIYLLEECMSLECRYQLQENCFLMVIYEEIPDFLFMNGSLETCSNEVISQHLSFSS